MATLNPPFVMVRFEKDHFVVQVEGTGEPLRDYLTLLGALHQLGWFVTEYGKQEPAVLQAYAKLVYTLALPLTEVDETQLNQAEKALAK